MTMRITRCVVWFVILATAFVACEKPKKEITTKKEKIKDGLFVSHFKNGKVKLEIPMKAGKQHGLAKEYYEDGTLAKEIEYKDGKKHGTVKQFYQNGKPAFIYTYQNGKKSGRQERYNEKGALSSVSFFKEDEPCKGLIEYTLKGEPRKKYPTIVVQPVNTLYKNGKYTLNLSMSDKSRSAEFYLGKTDKDGCIDWSSIEYVYKERNSYVSTVEYEIAPGGFVMQTINIIAKVKTLQGNYYLTETKFNVSAEFN